MKPFYVYEFRPGKWHVCNRKSGLPVYDDAPYGKDEPLVFDEDAAIECARAESARVENELGDL